MRRHTRLVVEKQLLDAAAVAVTSLPWPHLRQTPIHGKELLRRVSGGLEVGLHLDEPLGMAKGTQVINIKTGHLCEAGEQRGEMVRTNEPGCARESVAKTGL